jgi:hypothetical protein
MPASKNISQFERNPHLKTTTRARLNPNHVDKRVWVVEVSSSKIPKTIRWWHIGKRSLVGQEDGRGFERVGGPELGAVAIIILLKLLHEMICSCVEETKGSTHWSKSLRLHWDDLVSSYIPMHVHVWRLWILLWILSRGVTVRQKGSLPH